MNFIFKIGCILSFLFHSNGTVKAFAQPDSTNTHTTISTQKIMLLKTPWSDSENAGALTFFDFKKKIGSAKLYTNFKNKDYRLFREGDAVFINGFLADGFVKYKNWNFYGNFNYYSQTEKNVIWTGMMNPHNDNPYSISDSVGGNYSKEYFTMQGKGALGLNKLVTLGMDITYSAGVGAKRKDPRFENTVTSFTISPGAIFTLKNIKLGANLKYQGGKEDIEISDVTNTAYSIFHFKGLGAFSSTLEYDRQNYISNQWGGGVQLNFTGKKIQNLTTANFCKNQTNINRGETYPLQVALLEKFTTSIHSTFVLLTTHKNVNRLDLFFVDNKLFGTEPVVEPILQSVSYQWSTVAKYTLYWHKEAEAGFRYSYHKIIDKNRFNWGGQITGSYNRSKTTYYFVPEYNRQILKLLNLNAKLEKSLQLGENDVVFEITGGYRKNVNGKLEIVKDEYLQTIINTEMVNHDFNHYNSGLFRYGASATFGRNLSLVQKTMQIFAEAGLNRLKSDLPDHRKSTFFEFTLGLNF